MTQVLVIGGGIAGACTAYFAARAGAEVTLIDAGQARASGVPAALINPVRGQNGRVEPRAVAGMRQTWALLDALMEAGFELPHGRAGLYRPVPDAPTEQRWAANLPDDLSHAWRSADQVPGLAPGWHCALFVPEGGWLDGGAFVRALISASGARVIRARARRWSQNRATLSTQQDVAADLVFWCGGSVGAGWAGLDAQHRGGSLLTLDRAPAPLPLSFGVYASPAAVGGVLGATFEAPSSTCAVDGPAPRSLAWLTERAGRLLADPAPAVTGMWSGSRLSGLRCGRGLDGVWTLAGLGSKGFLLGPLLARHLVGDALGQVGMGLPGSRIV